ncbi:MAG: hypothetical protein QM750_21155 [Rubrivivax sp.]
MKHRTTRVPALRRTAIAAALALAGMLPAKAAIVTSGLVNTDPSGGTVAGFLLIGTSGPGTLTVDGGSTLTAQRLTTAVNLGSSGSVVVSGAGSSITADFGAVSGTYNTNVGSQGVGSLSVLNGASFINGLNDANCQLNCRLKVSNAAGSQGTLLVSGAGSTFDTVGGVQVGWASRFTLGGPQGIDYGIAGGASKGQASVLAGGTVGSSFLDIGRMDLNSELTGAETAGGKVVVDGAGSTWNLVRNAAQSGSIGLLNLASTYGSSGTLDIQNGGLVRLDGSSAPGLLSGITMGTAAGANAAGSQAAITVSGAGSRLLFDGGGTGFFVVGRGNGSVAQVTVDSGGVVTGTGGSSLPFMSVGRGGGTGTLDVSGAGSLVRLAGLSPVDGSGAFLQIGLTEANAAGHGTVAISQGGRVEIDTSGSVPANPNSLSGMHVGIGAGSNGALSVSGPGSRLDIRGGDGLAPYLGVGRDGATGSVTITGGAVVELSNNRVSAPNPAGYPSGEALLMDVGRRASGADGNGSTGTVTVSGAGSELTMTGATDARLQIGAGAQASGTLNLLNGGRFHGQVVLVGATDTTATGTVNMNAGQMVLDGVRGGSTVTGSGGGIIIGRGGATGTVNMSNGSTLSVTSTGTGAFVELGGSSALGGTGTLNVMGGSTVSVNSPNAAVRVGNNGVAGGATGIGTVNLAGAGSSLAAGGSNARVLIGASAQTLGQVNVGAGAALSATSLIGVAHDGTASTGGTGTLVVNGTATAAQLFVGHNGLLAGSGVVNADVVNQGVVNPGNSPGKLTINGAFDNSGGKIVLEVQSLGNGQYAMDELIFSDWSQVFMGDGTIEFVFLGDTDPAAFQDAGLFGLGSFFKQLDGNGNEVALDDGLLARFADAGFSASAAAFTITGLAFDPLTGAFNATVATVPLPAPVLLALLGLALLGLQRRRACV